MFQRLGEITRHLHDALQQLGVMPKLQVAADGIPDARSRLNYIADKTAAAADKVLNSVDAAKADHAYIAAETRRIGELLVADWNQRFEAYKALFPAEAAEFERRMKGALETLKHDLAGLRTGRANTSPETRYLEPTHDSDY